VSSASTYSLCAVTPDAATVLFDVTLKNGRTFKGCGIRHAVTGKPLHGREAYVDAQRQRRLFTTLTLVVRGRGFVRGVDTVDVATIEIAVIARVRP